MRTRIASIVIVIIMALVLVPLSWSTNFNDASAAPKKSDPIVNCSDVRINSKQVKIVCTAAGIVVLNTTVDLPVDVQTVTIPPIRVTLPAVTQTVHATVTQTATAHVTTTTSGPTKIVTVTASPVNSASGLPTTKPTSAGQTKTKYVTVEASPTAGPQTNQPQHHGVLPIPDGVVKKAAVGLVTTLILMALTLLGMYFGYYLGYRDSDQANARFMRALRDGVMSRKH